MDGLLAEAGCGLATQGIPASPGVTAAQAADTVIVPWNDPESLPRASSPRSSASPTRPTWAWCCPRRGFLAKLRELADETGALLVFDEVISGFRVAPRRRPGARGRDAPT